MARGSARTLTARDRFWLGHLRAIAGALSVCAQAFKDWKLWSRSFATEGSIDMSRMYSYITGWSRPHIAVLIAFRGDMG